MISWKEFRKDLRTSKLCFGGHIEHLLIFFKKRCFSQHCHIWDRNISPTHCQRGRFLPVFHFSNDFLSSTNIKPFSHKAKPHNVLNQYLYLKSTTFVSYYTMSNIHTEKGTTLSSTKFVTLLILFSFAVRCRKLFRSTLAKQQRRVQWLLPKRQ